MRAARPGADVRAGDHGAERHAAGNAFGRAKDIGLDAPMLAGKHFSGPAEAGLNFVGNQENAVVSAKLLEHRQIFRRRHHIAAFALNRLDENRRHLFRPNLVTKKGVLDHAHALDAAGAVREMVGTTMAKAIGNMMDAGNQRPEMGAVRGAASGERQRAERPAVESAMKSDHVLALGMIARELESGFHGLGAGIGEEYFFRRRARRQPVELFRQLDHRFVIIIAAADMEKFPRLFFDRLHHSRMRMPRAGNGDARHEVEEAIAVDVFDDHPLPAFHHQRINPSVGGRGDLVVALDDRLSFGTGKGRLDIRCFHVPPVSSLSFLRFQIR